MILSSTSMRATNCSVLQNIVMKEKSSGRAAGTERKKGKAKIG